jgi:hypothetical protein
VYPGAPELCDSQDNDCDGTSDDGVSPPTWYADTDGDGYGDAGSTLESCEPGSGWVVDDTDCDDTDEAIHPGAPELCDGTDTDCDGVDATYVPTDESTIAAAISAASAGDTICVEAGTYREDVDFGGVDLRLLGAGAGTTTLDGSGSGPVVTFAGGETVAALLDGFTVTGGGADLGGGILVSSSAPTLSNLIVTANSSGGGAAVHGMGIAIEFGDPVLTDVTVSNHSLTGLTTSLDVRGLGFYAESSNAELTRVVVTGNTFSGTGLTQKVAGCGMGLYGFAGTLTDVEVTNNSCQSSGFGFVGRGGGLRLSGNPVIDGLLVADNTLTAPSFSSYLYGGGVFNQNAASFNHTLITGNALVSTSYSTVAEGGGIWIEGAPILTNVVVADNSVATDNSFAASGGGIFVQGTADLVNVAVVGNQAVGTSGADGEGGGVFIAYKASATAVNVDVSDNSATGGTAVGGGWYASGTSATVPLVPTYCNTYGNTPDDYNNLTDPTGTDGNISDDPDYADTSGGDASLWDLTLGSSSTLIDGGDTTITDPDGSTSDIGAYGGPGGAW